MINTKKRGIVISFMFIILIYFAYLVNAQGNEGVTNNNEKDFTFTDSPAPVAGVPVTATGTGNSNILLGVTNAAWGGQSYDSAKNAIPTSDGGLVSADEASFDVEGGEGTGKGLEGVEKDGTDYTIQHADFWQTPTHTIINGNNIVGSGESICVGSSESIDRKSDLVSYSLSYCSDDRTIELASAKAVVIDNLVFTDIGPSTFKVDRTENIDSADVVSAKNDNTFIIKDSQIIADTGEEFRLTFTSRGMKLFSNSNIILFKEFQDFLGFGSLGRADYEFGYGIVCADIAPNAEYRSLDENPFAINNTGSLPHKLCLKRTADRDISCSNCSIIDFLAKNATLNGILQYKKLNNESNFTVIIDSPKNSSFGLLFDSRMDNITSAKAAGSSCSMFSGPFSLYYNSTYSYAFADYRTPYTIQSVNSRIDISAEGRLYVDETRFNMFAYGSEAYKEAL
jgi:hypothetical protein